MAKAFIAGLLLHSIVEVMVVAAGYSIVTGYKIARGLNRIGDTPCPT